MNNDEKNTYNRVDTIIPPIKPGDKAQIIKGRVYIGHRFAPSAISGGQNVAIGMIPLRREL